METLKKIITVKRVVALLITVFVILFAAQNMNPVRISFIVFSAEIPLLFLILGLFVLGVLVGIILQKRKSSQNK